jgi:putative ABC transport system substrate-binding protein
MRRRRLIALLGGVAASCVSWPLAARAQQVERMRGIGVLAPGTKVDIDQQSRLKMFQDALQEMGWTHGRNVRIETRLAGGSTERFQTYGAELVAAKPDVLLADATPSTAALQRETRTIPIVFTRVTDPVGQGFVASMARPGSNVTGFTNYEPDMGGKWLELLKEAVPGIRRVAIIYNPQTAPFAGSFLQSVEAAARANGVALVDAPVHSTSQLDATIAVQGSEPGAGLLLHTDSFLVVHRDLIAGSAARHRLPTIGPAAAFTTSGSLMSYAVDIRSMYRGAASYVDRILRGEKAADLPVQGPTKFQLVINLKTAKALGLEISPMLLARADEVIE